MITAVFFMVQWLKGANRFMPFNHILSFDNKFSGYHAFVQVYQPYKIDPGRPGRNCDLYLFIIVADIQFEHHPAAQVVDLQPGIVPLMVGGCDIEKRPLHEPCQNIRNSDVYIAPWHGVGHIRRSDDS